MDYLEEWLSTRTTGYLDVLPMGWVTVYLETPLGTELDMEPAVRFYMDSEAGPLHQCMGMCIKNDVKVKPAIILTILGDLEICSYHQW